MSSHLTASLFYTPPLPYTQPLHLTIVILCFPHRLPPHDPLFPPSSIIPYTPPQRLTTSSRYFLFLPLSSLSLTPSFFFPSFLFSSPRNNTSPLSLHTYTLQSPPSHTLQPLQTLPPSPLFRFPSQQQAAFHVYYRTEPRENLSP